MATTPKKIGIIMQRLFLFLVFAGISNQINSQELGLQLYSLRDQFKLDVPGTLERINEWGIRTIKGGENTYGLEEKEFKVLLDKNNLTVVSTGTKYQELLDSLTLLLTGQRDLGKICNVLLDSARGGTFFHCRRQESYPCIQQSGQIFGRTWNRPGIPYTRL